jgi:hypothetical protein
MPPTFLTSYDVCVRVRRLTGAMVGFGWMDCAMSPMWGLCMITRRVKWPLIALLIRHAFVSEGAEGRRGA